MFQNLVKQRFYIFALVRQGIGRPTVTTRSKQCRKIQLLVRRPQIGKQVKNFVLNLNRSGIRPVNLVNDDNRAQAQFQGFTDHEFCLGEGALGRINQNNHAVHHG